MDPSPPKNTSYPTWLHLEHYVGMLYVVDADGDRHRVEALLTWRDPDADEWVGTLVGRLEWDRLAADGPFVVEYPGNRWWDLNFVNRVEIVSHEGDCAQVRGLTGRSPAPTGVEASHQARHRFLAGHSRHRSA